VVATPALAAAAPALAAAAAAAAAAQPSPSSSSSICQFGLVEQQLWQAVQGLVSRLAPRSTKPCRQQVCEGWGGGVCWGRRTRKGTDESLGRVGGAEVALNSLTSSSVQRHK
jgi:hypothetical protein